MILMNLRNHKRLWMIAIILMIGLILFHSKYILRYIYPFHYEKLIEKHAHEYELDPYLIAAIIQVESKFDEKAKSSKNAKGLMQISSITGQWASKELQFKDYEEGYLFIPETNIKIGCWYLNKLRKQFNGNLQLILAAYNGGSGNVSKWLQDKRYSDDGKKLKHIPFPETDNYVSKVLRNYKIYSKLYEE